MAASDGTIVTHPHYYVWLFQEAVGADAGQLERGSVSNYWDLHCIDCDVPAHAFHWNHGEDKLRKLVRSLPSIAALDIDKDTYIELEMRYCGAETSSWDSLVSFSKAHHGHNVKPRSEYGYVDDQCSSYVDCEHCNSSRRNCKLKEGHEGAHEA